MATYVLVAILYMTNVVTTLRKYFVVCDKFSSYIEKLARTIDMHGRSVLPNFKEPAVDNLHIFTHTIPQERHLSALTRLSSSTL